MEIEPGMLPTSLRNYVRGLTHYSLLAFIFMEGHFLIILSYIFKALKPAYPQWGPTYEKVVL